MRLGCRKGFVHRHASSEPESEFGAVDAVIASVDEADGDVDDVEAERALTHRFAHAILDRWDPLLRDGPAVNLLLEMKAFPAAQRTDFDNHVAELAVPAGLLLVSSVLADGFPDRFPVAHGRCVGFHLYAVAPLEAGKHGVEMLLVDALQADLVIGFVMLDD